MTQKSKSKLNVKSQNVKKVFALCLFSLLVFLLEGEKKKENRW